VPFDVVLLVIWKAAMWPWLYVVEPETMFRVTFANVRSVVAVTLLLSVALMMYSPSAKLAGR
jgi:hypothetical protein